MLRRMFLAATVALLTAPLAAEDGFIVVQSTTSTKNSGLFDHLLPLFEAAHGIEVRVVAVGTGQALKNASNGDGDVLLVHARAAEEAFIADGHGRERLDVMYNDFVVVGPTGDPAGVAGKADVTEALAMIAGSDSTFTSRGDDSGTHKAELGLWDAAEVPVRPASGTWYRETGAGMGTTLNIAVEMGAYALTDRATWIAFGNKRDHAVLVEGDDRLFNQYGVVSIDPVRHPNVKAEAAQVFIDWLVSEAGQAAIGAYRVDGQQLFFPNAP